MFPEIRASLKSAFAGFGSEPIGLGLKQQDVSFDAVNVGWYARNGFQRLYSMLGGGSETWSNENVSLQTALNNSVVWACNRIISESVGFIPALMYQRKAGAKQPAEKHPMYSALKDAPNEEITAQGFTEMLTGHCVLGGNSFAKITRRSGTGVAIGLDALCPEQVTPDREKTGEKRLVYVVRDGNAADKTYTVVRGKPQDILHIRGFGWDGLRGYSVITMARQSIGSAIAAERNVANFFANGGRVPYNLKINQVFKDEKTKDKFREDWRNTYSVPGKVPILEPWLEYQQTGLSMADSQMLESRQFSIPEICRWFSVSPHLVGDLSRATFSNIEHLTLEFVKMTLAAWITRWEQELWRCVLTPEEKTQGYFWRHDVNALLRGDFKTRMEGYASALQNGHLNVDEVRDLEDRNPLPDGAGEDYHIQLNMQKLPAENAPQDSASLVRLGGKKGRAA